jgi:hypothetical protein
MFEKIRELLLLSREWIKDNQPFLSFADVCTHIAVQMEWSFFALVWKVTRFIHVTDAN